MVSMRRRIVLALLGVTLLAVFLWQLTRPAERVVYLGGPVITLDAANRVVEALGVQGNRIAAVGSEPEVRRWAGDGARIVDLQGYALLPGFIDAHSHYPGAGLTAVMADLNSPPIGDVESIGDIVTRLREQASRKSSGWVLGLGYDDSFLAERRHPTREDLDRVAGDRPIAIFHISGHLAALNSAGLERSGIDPGTPDPPGGRIVRDPRTREPSGVVEEAIVDDLRNRLFRPSLREEFRIMRQANALYLRAGVTTAQNGAVSVEQARLLRRASHLGLVPFRLVLWPTEEAAETLLAREHGTCAASEWVRCGAVKLFADGSIQGYTAHLRDPYHVYAGNDPAYRGYPRVPHEQLIERVRRHHEAGLQIAMHANGDAAIDSVLDAFEAAQRAHPRVDPRHIIIHAQMARGDQLDRMKALGVIPSFFPLHTYYWADRHREIFLGPERTERISPARSALERGLRFTAHADTPVVPMEPLRIVWSLVNRRSTGGRVIGPSERIDVMNALRAVTINAAYQYFEEAEKGSLEPGKIADLAILGRSALDDPEHIDSIEVRETIVGGRTVYRKED